MRAAAAGLTMCLALTGCEAALGFALLGAGAGVAAGSGIEHTMNGIAYRTFTAPMQTMRLAALRSLDRMGMTLTEDKESKDGWQLIATAAERVVDLRLQRITEQTTRMRVVTSEGEIFFKDAATSTEIVMQTAQALDEINARTAAPARKRG